DLVPRQAIHRCTAVLAFVIIPGFDIDAASRGAYRAVDIQIRQHGAVHIADTYADVIAMRGVVGAASGVRRGRNGIGHGTTIVIVVVEWRIVDVLRAACQGDCRQGCVGEPGRENLKYAPNVSIHETLRDLARASSMLARPGRGAELSRGVCAS